MKRLVVFCEGASEQGFCRQLLQPHLFPSHDGIVQTFAVGRANDRNQHGVSRYAPFRKFVRNTLNSPFPKTYFTTLIDLYALPGDFPGKSGLVRDPTDPSRYVESLEEALSEDFDDDRLIPFLVLHEYETMLYANPDGLAIAFENRDKAIEQLKTIIASFESIEHINDGYDTAPSRRLARLIPEYAALKASAGPDIAEFIGLAKIRACCPHVDRWLKRLESLDWTRV